MTGTARRGSSTVLVAVAALLVGFFLGFEAGNIVFSPAEGESPRPAGPAVSSLDQAPSGMTDQIKSLEEKVTANPGDAQAWVALGNAYFDLDNPTKAVAAYQKALTINPNLADVWTDLGVMQRSLSQPEQALASFSKAVSINPRHEIALLNQGVVYLYDLGQPEKAAAAWRKLLAINAQAMLPGGRGVADMVAEITSAPKK